MKRTRVCQAHPALTRWVAPWLSAMPHKNQRAVAAYHSCSPILYASTSCTELRTACGSCAQPRIVDSLVSSPKAPEAIVHWKGRPTVAVRGAAAAAASQAAVDFCVGPRGKPPHYVVK